MRSALKARLPLKRGPREARFERCGFCKAGFQGRLPGGSAKLGGSAPWPLPRCALCAPAGRRFSAARFAAAGFRKYRNFRIPGLTGREPAIFAFSFALAGFPNGVFGMEGGENTKHETRNTKRDGGREGCEEIQAADEGAERGGDFRRISEAARKKKEPARA